MIAIVDSEYLRSRHAQVALPGPYHFVRSVGGLSLALEQANISTVIFDPRGMPDDKVLAAVEKAAQLRKRLFFVSEPTSRVTDLTLRAVRRGLTGASFCGCPLDASHVRSQLRLSPGDVALPARLLADTSDALWRLPPRLRGELVAFAVTVCRGSMDIDSLARRAGGSTRSVARWMADAGMREPRWTCAVLRVGHLWPDLWMPEVTMPELARRARYSSDRTMRAHCRRVMGSCPRHMRRFLTDDDVAAALADAMRRSVDQPRPAMFAGREA